MLKKGKSVTHTWIMSVDIIVMERTGEKIKYKIELSTNTVALISCRCRLTKVLAGAAREKKGGRGLMKTTALVLSSLMLIRHHVVHLPISWRWHCTAGEETNGHGSPNNYIL